MKHIVKKLDNSQVAIDVTIPQEDFEKYRDGAIDHLGSHMEVQGFRKGKAPREVVEKEIKPFHILEEMAERAVNDHLTKILVDEKIDAIGRPMISLTKLAADNPFEFTATVDVLPEIKLADYKKIAKEINKNEIKVELTDEEFEKAIIDLKKARAAQEKKEATDEEATAELTDEYVAELGPFKSVDEFKEKFRENILNEKKSREIEKRRIETMDKILEETNVSVPETLIANEVENLIARMQSDVARMGMKFEDYLTHVKKTEEDIRKDIRPDAEKKAKGELIIYEISKIEKLSPKKEDVEKEVKQVMEFYKDADESKAQAYVTHLLTNEEVFKFLESQK